MFKRYILVLLGLAGLVAVISACSPLEAQTSYQGQLTTSSGSPVSDGDYEMTFRLYNADDAAVGDALWSESQNVAVSNGLFNVTLGAAEDITTTIFAQKLWLGVEVESDGEMTPRQQLTGAPYAMSLVAGAGIQGTVNKDDPLPGSLNINNRGNGYGVGVLALGEAGLAMEGGDVGQTGMLIDKFTHGAVITSTEGTGLKVNSTGGAYLDYWGVWGNSETGDGVLGVSYGPGDGDTGVTGNGENGYGVYGFSVYGTWGLYTPDELYVGNGCTGCALQYISYNASDATLQTGDTVAAAGVDFLEGMSTPVMKVAPAAAGEAVLGVVVGATEMYTVEAGVLDAQQGAHFGDVGGPAAPGDYLIIVVQGPAQVRASDASIQPGDIVYQDSAGIRSEALGPPIGMALEGVDADSMVWVLVGFH